MAQFINKMTIAQVKAANGNAAFTIGESSKPGIFLFSCGADHGYCSKAAAQESDASKLQVCDVIADDGQTYRMVTLASGGIQTVVRSF